MRPLMATIAAVLAVACAGCGGQATGVAASGSHRVNDAPLPTTPRARPQSVEPVAGAAAPASGPNSESAGVSVGSASQGSGALPQPASIDSVKAELTQSGLSADPNQATLTPGGLAIAPVSAPPEVQAIINAGNEIAHLPYVWGGGHMTYEDNGYDCSGSISFVLAAASLLKGTETSGQLMSYGDAGRGKWITIFATNGHTFMYVAGLRFDTVALAEGGSRWSNRSANDGGTFVARHPPGL